MTNNVNDPWDDPDLLSTEEQQVEEPVSNEPVNEEQVEEPSINDSLITKILSERGIEDASKIKFENEKGEIEETAWDDLSLEDRLNIINSSSEDPETDLDENELDLINAIRKSNLTPEEYIKAVIADNTKKEEPAPEPKHSVDSISDDQLYLYDILSKSDQKFSDEELGQMLESAKSNEELYNKVVQGLRSKYKKMEDEQIAAQEEAVKKEQEEQYNKFKEGVVREIRNFKSLGNLDLNLDENDMSEIADYILTPDKEGVSQFARDINDLPTLVKMAWFAKNSDKFISGVNDYIADSIKNAKRHDFSSVLKPIENKTKVYAKPNNKQSNSNQSKYLTIDDLD